MAKSLFSKLIFCANCLGGMRVKTERKGQKVYICSRHSNDSSVCTREALIREEFLILLIKGRYGEDVNIREVVDRIIVKNPTQFEIKFNNQDESILFSGENFIRF